MSSPGITFMQKFVTAKEGWNIGKDDTYDYFGRTGKFKKSKNDFSLDYYNYSSRGLISDEAAPQFVAYKLPENESSGNFDCDMDLLGPEQIEYYRDLERKSLASGCTKYLGVISFDNDFLKEFNIITKDELLNVGRLRELTRSGVNALVSKSKKLDNDNVYWTAGIHMDTDNIHIHLYLLEYERKEDWSKIYPDKDKLEVQAFDKLKSKIGNGIVGPERNIAISKMERDILPAQISANYTSCAEQLTALALKLPPPNSRGIWEYGRLGKYQRDVNKTVDAVIMSNPQLKEQFLEYLKMLDDHMELDRRMYGEGERQLWCNFKRNKLKEFRNKTGNALLKYLPEVRDAAMHSDYDNYAHLSEEKIPSGYVDSYIRRSDEQVIDDEYFDQLIMDEQLVPREDGETVYAADDLPDEYLEEIYDDIPPEQPSSEDASDFYEQLTAIVLEFVDDRYDDQALLRIKDPLLAYANATEYERMTDKNGILTELLNVKRELDDELTLAEIYSAHNFTDEQKKLIAEGFHNGLSRVILEQINENFTPQQIITYFDMFDRAVKGEIDPHDVQVYLDEQCPTTRGTPEERTGPFIEWTDEYKNALEIMYSKNPDFDMVKDILLSESENGNVLATHDLGKLYGNKLIDVPDGDRFAQEYYSQAFEKFNNILINDKTLNSFELPNYIKKHVEWETAYLNYRIGKMYNRGLGVPQDLLKAKEHYLEAGGNKYAEFALGNIYKYGSGTDKDLAAALIHYEKSADLGMPFADYALGTAYESGQGTDADKVKAKQYYAKALDGFIKIHEKSPDDTIAYKIGVMHFKGKGTDADLKKAEEYLSLSAKANNPNAQYMLGKLYLTQEHLDLVKAEQIFIKAADEHNNHHAQYALGKLYLEHYGDLSKAKEYFLKSAEQDNEFAQYALGKLYLSEDKPFYPAALHYFGKAADEHNNPYAQYALGKIYLKQYGDFNNAEKYFIKAAEQNNEFAQYQLGKLYSNPPNEQHELAIKYYKLAADKHKNQYAQYRLGKIYMSEEHLNYSAAEQYLSASETQGNEAACYLLGRLYLTEEHHDLSKAEQFLTKAADEYNNPYAQYQLGKLYLSEDRYDRDMAEEYLLRSALQNNNSAQLRLGLLYMKENNSEAASYWIRAAAEQDNKIALDILSHPPKKEIKVSPQYRIAKGNLARASYNALKKIYGEMDRHVRKLLVEAAREEEQERFKNNRRY